MEFAGEWTYAPKDENEDNDFEEVEVEMDEEEDDAPAPAPAPPSSGGGFFARLSSSISPAKKEKKPVVAKHKVKKANTNVLAVDLSTLSSDAELVAGDPFFCGTCSAVFSSHSKVEASGKWFCEFCNAENVSTLEEEEKPKNVAFDFILEPAPKHTASESNQPLVIFCVDISGSMCSSTEVPGNFKLKGRNNTAPQLEAGDDRYQHIPGSNRNVTYVSRLQCVQAAIESQLETMSQQMPNARVALVTFNSDVTIYGDCLGVSPTVISGDKLNSFEQLVAIGEANKNIKPISESKKKMVDKLMKLEENGPTALGPAVAVCLGMARGSLGSRIVLATDGLSNTGIGAMDVELLMHEAQEYYDKLAVVALGQSTSINIVGIRGGDSVCMAMLGKMSDASQGEVNLVDPLNIVSEFASMLQSKIVATHVTIKLLLHKGLRLVNIDASKLVPGAPSQGPSVPSSNRMQIDEDSASATEQSVGNAYDDSELTFEYEVKSAAKLEEIFAERAKLVAGSEKTLPFQVQITYTKLDGSKCIRVITRTQAITHDRAQAERTVNAGMLGTHAWAQSARLAEQGHYEAAMVNNMQMGAMFSRAPITAKQSAQYAEGTSNFNAHMRTGLKKKSAASHSAAAPAPYPPQGYASAAPAYAAQQQQQQQQQALFDDDDASTAVLQFKGNRKARKNLDRD